MKTLSISRARNRLPSLVAGVMQDRQTILLTRYGKPMAAITPVPEACKPAMPYPLRGKTIRVASDFDEPTTGLWEALTVAEPRGEYRAATPKASKSAKQQGRRS